MIRLNDIDKDTDRKRERERSQPLFTESITGREKAMVRKALWL